ncbi:NADH:flavin oxidoreductase/NADH oxidase family protein [Salinicoccus cyprini]|uniref:NADH:flavin oxidoreductase/NADH oxidase family protein n=2 Tax=Salinicoccus cyprini TaxID=2493691 RepID=A0A558AUZ7_9STAP|nr:NADH:flavin oxidoreductase/NADH oxidase family protein [Salinicoccus cyprini]
MMRVAEPLKLANGVELKNRFFKSAMSETMASSMNQPNEKHIRLYHEWAKGGAGVVVTGNVMVDRNALGEPGNVVIEDERDIGMLREWARKGTENGTQLWMQLNHPGKQSPKSMSKKPVAPSAVPLGDKFRGAFNPPRALTVEEIKQLVQKFANTARLARKAGFTGVQIHGAHGYLVNQFLSPHDNQREDEYGGRLENRMKFLVEIYEEMRYAVGADYPIALKLNSSDFSRVGFTEEESIQVVEKMASLGLDLIEISGGNYEQPKMSTGTDSEVFFLDYARKLKEEVDIPVVVTGGFRSPESMESALEKNHTDMIGIARPLALEPHLPKEIMAGSNAEITTQHLTTGVKALDANIGPAVGNVYYAMQLKRIAEGKATQRHTNAWRPLLHLIATHGPHALKPKRR